MAKTQKLEFDIVKHVIEKHVGSDAEKALVIADIQKVLREKSKKADQNKADKENAEKPIRVIVTTNKMLDSQVEEKTGWIIDVLPKHAIGDLDGSIQAAIQEFNCSKKGKRNPIDTIGNGLEAMGPKLTKEHGFHVKTKLPTALVVIDSVVRKAPVLAD